LTPYQCGGVRLLDDAIDRAEHGCAFCAHTVAAFRL
jgi:hypothetical protein